MIYNVNDKIEWDSKDLAQGRILASEGNTFRFLYKEKMYTITVLEENKANKEYKMVVNGYTMKVRKSNELDQLIQQLGFNKPPVKSMKEILAPMPGLVKSIFVQPGQAIEPGDNLLILEAMKMENIIKSAGVGVISTIEVGMGEKVEKGQILIKL